jgi:DNA-binding CsgD family transcriptional regulator
LEQPRRRARATYHARASRPVGLSPRQLQAAELVARDMSNREIAAELGIGMWWTEKLVCSTFHRLGLESRLQLALWYWKQQKGVAA